jgi:hypothetical protein
MRPLRYLQRERDQEEYPRKHNRGADARLAVAIHLAAEVAAGLSDLAGLAERGVAGEPDCALEHRGVHERLRQVAA